MATEDPTQTITSLLERSIPLPMVLSYLTVPVISETPGLTALVAVLVIFANVIVRVGGRLGVGQTTVGWCRFILTFIGVTLLIVSAGPVHGAWFVALPGLIALPLIMPAGPRWVPPLALAVVASGATLFVGLPWQEALLALMATGAVGLTSLPAMTVLKRQITALTRASKALEERTRTLEDARTTAVDAQRIAEDARAEAEAAMNARQAFLATVSHELRTPVSGVIGLLDLAADGTLSKAQRREHLDLARGASKHLLGVVNDILDLARLESGKVDLERQAIELGTLAREVIEVVRIGRRSDVPIRLRVAPSVGWRSGDAIRIRQVLLNLVSNAVKFTERGEVRVKVLGDARHVQVVVSDTGIGMSRDQLARIFEPFE